MILIGRDKIAVPANRFVLSCASPIMEKMIVNAQGGPLKTGVPHLNITIDGYDSKVLQALVNHCCFHKLNVNSFVKGSFPHSAVALAKLANEFQFRETKVKAADLLKAAMATDPTLASLVVVEMEQEHFRELIDYAWPIIYKAPAKALGIEHRADGGFSCLDPHHVQRLIFLLDPKKIEPKYCLKLLQALKNFHQVRYESACQLDKACIEI